MKKKSLLVAGIILCISILLSACEKEQADMEDIMYIGVACYNQSDVFLGELLECFKAECSKMDVAVTIRDAIGSQRNQNDQVKELIDEGCDILCVNLVDRTDPSEIIDMAKENDVPIIFFNREPVAEDLMQWDGLYYVGAEAKQAGVMQGELAADLIHGNQNIDRNNDGAIQYVILEGESGHQDAIIRTESVVNTLKECGIELERLSYGIANWNRAQAQNRMIQMLSQYPTEIELVLANNDAMALGAIDAYKELNYSETEMPAFFGIDGTNEGLSAIKESKLSATVYNDKEGQAEVMVKLAVALRDKEGIEKFEFEKGRYIYLPYAKVTLENVEDFSVKKTNKQ